MPSYDWREYRDASFGERFPSWAEGAEEWRVKRVISDLPSILDRERRRQRPHLARPRVFVSHRQVDIDPALRIAYLACQEGFDYWLDVLDPTLKGPLYTSVSAPPNQGKALATAATIEMGLLNCTHVVAVVTPNTKGSQWIPYEYGRVKEPTPISLQAGSWVDASVGLSDLPEYLYLGVITTTEAHLRTWLRSERSKYPSLAPPSPCGWTNPVPSPL
jgi:hypothetical protein